MTVTMGRYQIAVIHLTTLIILAIGSVDTASPFPDPEDRTPSGYHVARIQAGNQGKLPSGNNLEPDPPPMQKPLPQNQSGKWIFASPVQLGFNPAALETSVEQIGRMNGIYSLIIVRNGYLVIERYFREGHRSKPHNLKSASKSILSALIGIAIDEGYLGLNQPISDVLPQGKVQRDPRKSAITVRHLLTMTSGLSPTSYQAYNAWVLNGDWVKAALDRPLTADPGTRFTYSTANSHLLSAALTAATGMSTYAFASEKLFDPMNITVHGWDTDPQGIYQGGNNLSLIPLDMAKIGLLYLNGGRYGDRQLVPKQWINASTRVYYQAENDVYGGYGYLWFCQPGGKDAFVAVGYGGQYIYVSKPYDCVIVVTATLESKGRKWEKQLFRIIQNHILRNIQTDQPQQVIVAGLSDNHLPVTVDLSVNVQLTGQTTKILNMRSDANSRSKWIGWIPKYSPLDILDTRGKWYRVTYGKKEGWVHSAYVDTTNAQQPSAHLTQKKSVASKTPTSVEPLKRDNGFRIGRATARLNLRKGPSKDDQIIDIFAEGTPLEVNEQWNGWLRVKAKNLNGWVSARYVRMASLKTVARSTNRDISAFSQKPIPTITREKKPVIVDLAPSSRNGEVKELQNLMAQLQNRLSTSEKIQQQALISARAGQNEMAKELEKVRTQVLAQDDRLEAMQMDRDSLNNELALLQKEVKAEKGVASQSRLEHDALRTELKSAREEIHRLTVDAEHLQTAKEDLEVDTAGVRKAFVEQQEAIRRSFSESSRLREELTSTGKDINALKSALADFETVQDNLNEELIEVREEVKNQHKTISEREADLKPLVSDLAEIRQNIDTLNRTLSTTTAARVDDMGEQRRLRKDLDSQQQSMKKAAEIQKDLVKALALSKKQRTAMEKRLHDSDTQRRSLTENQDKMRDELDLQYKAMALCEAHDKSQAIELTGMRDTIATLTEKLKMITADLETATDEREHLIAALTKVKEDLALNKKALVNARSDKKAMKSTFGEMRSQIVAQEEILKSMQIDRERLNNEVALLRKNIKEANDDAIQSVSERKALKEKLRSAEEVIEGLKTETGDLRSVQEKKNKELIKVRRVVENQRKFILQTKTDLEILESALASANKTIVGLNRDLASARAAGMDGKAGVARLSKELDVQHGTIKKTAATQKDIAEALESTGKDINALKDALSDSQTEREALNAELVAAHKRIVKLEAEFRRSPKDTPIKQPLELTESSDIPAPVSSSPDTNAAAIDAFVWSWSSAWERKDVKAYLSHYSKRFQPSGRIGQAEWSRQRRERLLKPAFVNIGISDLRKKMVNASRGEVSFIQIYLSDTYFDRVIKTLDIQLENGEWKIMRETSRAK